jgi:predicted ATPase
MANPDQRLITLAGPTGVGKTRLALEAAARANGPSHTLFLDGVFLVRLDGIDDPAELPGTIAQALGMTTGATRHVTLEGLLRRIQDREMLLVLDGFDGLYSQREMLVALLERAPELQLLVICQKPLRLPGERVYTLKHLATTAEQSSPYVGAPLFSLHYQLPPRPLLVEHSLMA